jgi:hypothetical protein
MNNFPELPKPRKAEDYDSYYQKLKNWQLNERDKLFHIQFSSHNPLSSKNPIIANQKERKIWRELFYRKFSKEKIRSLLKLFVIPCDEVEPELEFVLTNDLLISCLGRRIRKYKKVRATQLGGNQFKWYLVKENWKRETPNHLIWKFELKRLLNCMIERPDADTQGRFDAVWNTNKRKIIIEIICKRQSIDYNFHEKIDTKAPEIEGKGFIVLLAPQHLHKHLQVLAEEHPDIVFLANSKNILDLLQQLAIKRLPPRW